MKEKTQNCKVIDYYIFKNNINLSELIKSNLFYLLENIKKYKMIKRAQQKDKT